MALGSLLGAFRRRWWLVVAAAVIAGAIGFTAASIAAPTYVASAQVVAVAVGTGQPAPGTDMTEAYEAEQFSRLRVPEYTSFADTRTFLQRVVDKHQLPMTRDQLARILWMSSPEDTAVITVTVRTDSPVLAADVANASAEELTEVVREREMLVAIRAIVADYAAVPKSPVAPQLWRTVAQSAVIGLIVGAVAAVGLALMHGPFETEAVPR